MSFWKKRTLLKTGLFVECARSARIDSFSHLGIQFAGDVAIFFLDGSFGVTDALAEHLGNHLGHNGGHHFFGIAGTSNSHHAH